jgi:hypothetical protein
LEPSAKQEQQRSDVLRPASALRVSALLERHWEPCTKDGTESWALSCEAVCSSETKPVAEPELPQPVPPEVPLPPVMLVSSELLLEVPRPVL